MDKYKKIVLRLQKKGVLFENGMSPSEIIEIEGKYRISFPIELKQLYFEGLPVSEGFYNWRDMSAHNVEYIRSILERPILDLQEELKDEEFWCDDWGKRPDDFNEANKILLTNYNNSPKLIPVYIHRYMPSILDMEAVPIFSIMGSDIIYYGANLISYLEIEFGLKSYNKNMKCEYVNFWSDIVYN